LTLPAALWTRLKAPWTLPKALERCKWYLDAAERSLGATKSFWTLPKAPWTLQKALWPLPSQNQVKKTN